MARRSDPNESADLAAQKNAQQLRVAERMSFIKGVKAGGTAARELIAEGYNNTYEFESLVLHRLNVIDAEQRILSGSEINQTHHEILEAARARLPEQGATDQEYIVAAVAVARTANEAWGLHNELTGTRRNKLPEERRTQLAAAISTRFP